MPVRSNVEQWIRLQECAFNCAGALSECTRHAACDALRMFEEVAHNMGDEAEFVGCEFRVQPELAEEFGVLQANLPILIVRWEGLRGRAYLELNCGFLVGKDSDLRAIVRDLIAEARGLADIVCTKKETEG